MKAKLFAILTLLSLGIALSESGYAKRISTPKADMNVYHDGSGFPAFVPTEPDTVATPWRLNDNSKSGRQSVGLVLSGGGAKGIAHVGVIKALEDNDIPIDYITGTSMGAIVGSLYSMGWTPEQMIEFFSSKEFGYFASGTIDPKFTYYFAKPTPTPKWVSVNINPKDTTLSLMNQVLPTHLINALPMNMEFLKLYAPYTEQIGGDFNNLFVPFRCVTSDVYSKKKVVLSHGSLGDAVRASMSFPLVFKPIKLNGVLVYDGGIYDNFPVDVMQQDFNPDFIIGVSVSGPDTKPKTGNVYSQLEDMIIQNNDYSVPARNGIKIQVPVLQYGVLDFGQAQTIYDIGYQTGLAMVDSVKSRVSARRPLEEVNARRAVFKSCTPQLEFDSVRVEGATAGQSKYLRYLFDPKRNKPFGLDQVQDAYYRATMDGKLSNLLPQARFHADGNNTLLLEADVKQPWSIGVGGWITSSTHSMLFVDLGYHTLSLNSLDVDLSGWIGQSYYAAKAGAKFFIHSNVPSYMDAAFVVSRQKYYDTELLFYQSGSPSFITDGQVFFQLNYNWAIGRKYKGYAGLGYGWLHDSYYPEDVESFADAKKSGTHYSTLALRGGIERNSLNDLMYPNSGTEFKADLLFSLESNTFIPHGDKAAQVKYGSHPTASLEVKWKNFYPLHKNVTLGVAATGIISAMKLYQNYTATLVHSPAFAPTPSTRNYFNPRFRTPNYVAAGVMPIWMPVSKLQLRGDFYAFSPIRHIEQTADGMARYNGWMRDVEFIGEVAAVYNFSFASISLYGNYLSYPKNNFNFGINFGLLLQAPRLTR